jgi:cyclase
MNVNYPSLIARVLYSNGLVWQSVKFETLAPLGKISNIARHIQESGFDEVQLVFLDTVSELERSEVIMEFSSICNLPLTVGGGIDSIEVVSSIIRSGADKVSIRSALLSNTDLFKLIAEKFGRQSLVLEINIGDRESCFHSLEDAINLVVIEDLAQWIAEISVGTIAREGTMKGFKLLARDNRISGVRWNIGFGYANTLDIESAYSKGFNGYLIGNGVGFTEHSGYYIKASLKSIRFRDSCFLDYSVHDFKDRPSRRESEYYYNLNFKKITPLL